MYDMHTRILAMHIQIPFPVIVACWVVGVALWLTLPKMPASRILSCPACTSSHPVAIERPCTRWWVILLLVLLSPVGMLCIWVMRRRIRVRCLACRMVVLDGDVNAVELAMNTRAGSAAKPPSPKPERGQHLRDLHEALEKKVNEPFVVADPEDPPPDEDGEGNRNPFA